MKMLKRLFAFFILSFALFNLVSCGCVGCSAIELMGAGDRIHDTFTFANIGVKIKEEKENNYLISGSVEKLTDEKIKEEFDISSDINYVVAIKLTAIDAEVDKNNLTIMVDGTRSYDAEHLNSTNHSFIILEAIPGVTTSIKVKWNSEVQERTYYIKFANDLILK